MSCSACRRVAMDRLIVAIMLAVVCAIAWTSPSYAAGKVALVIGNNKYVHAPELANPVNDAKAVAAVLRQIGFKVIEHYDVGKAETGQIMEDFAKQAEAADIGLVYFAGHGIQVSGATYLVPVDVSLESDRDLRKLIPADYFLQDASQAQTVGVVILDACRDNPFIKRLSEATAKTRSVSVGRGLSRINDVPKKGLIAYATQAGNVALDGTGNKNSPYATALVKHLSKPNKDIRLVFGAIRDEVIEATDRQQEPYTYGSLGGDPIYLYNPSKTTTTPAPETQEVISYIPTTQLETSAPITSSYVAWKSAIANGSWEELTRLSRHSEQSVFTLLANHMVTMQTKSPELSVADARRALETQGINFKRVAPNFGSMIQAQLRDLNYFGGAVDGRLDADSQSALSAFVADWNGKGRVTAAAIVGLAERASERAAQSKLSGLWRGRYHYPRPINGVRSVAFEMDLTFSQGRVSGFVAEPNTFGDKTSENLYATFSGTVSGNHIEWKKTYDGTGGQSHSVWYRGTLDRKNRRIEGRWEISSNWSGDFAIELQ